MVVSSVSGAGLSLTVLIASLVSGLLAYGKLIL